jgi:hypothetical protein
MFVSYPTDLLEDETEADKNTGWIVGKAKEPLEER